MKYINAAEVLPEKLLVEIQNYIKGEMIYIPNNGLQKNWGEKSGSRKYYEKRNNNIKEQYKMGESIDKLSDVYGLAFDTVRKIIYS